MAKYKNQTITPIEENWEAILKLEEKLKAKTGDPDGGFYPKFMYFRKVRNLVIPMYSRVKNGNGELTKRKTEFLALARYCHFTGKPLYKESKTLKT